MAAARLFTATVAAVPLRQTLTNEAKLRSRTSSVLAGSCESSASQFCGQRFGVSSVSWKESRNYNGGARAYTATEERTGRGSSAYSASTGCAADLYESLGVSRTATAKEIKAAYRCAARRLHPDVVPADQREEATAAFLEVHNIYATLSDPERRAAYDMSLSVSASFKNFRNRDSVTMTPAWGFTPANEECYPSSGHFSFKGRNWETDQCW